MKQVKKNLRLLLCALIISFLSITVIPQLENCVTVEAATTVGTPKLVSAKASGTSKIKITWKKVSGASGYKIYRKDYDSSKWKNVKTVSGNQTSYTDTKLTQGMCYYYTVRAYSKNGSQTVLSNYNKKGVWAVTSLPAQTGVYTEIETGSNTICVNWDFIRGADGYYIYRKTKGSSWKCIKKTIDGTDTFYDDSNVEAGVTYYYRVYPYCKYNGKIFKGAYNKNSVSGQIKKEVFDGLRFSKTERILAKNGVYEIELDRYKGDYNQITWTSNNPSVATVDSRGEVTGIDYGEAIIMASAYGQTCECKIKVDKLLQVKEIDYTITGQKSINVLWAEYGGSGKIASYKIDNTNIVRCEWGERRFIDDYCVSNLIITPKRNGSTNIKLTNTFNDEVVVLHITTQNIETYISTDRNNLTVSKQETIIITNTSGGKMTNSYDSNYVSCEWGKWNEDDTIPLYITPKSNGTTTITITDVGTGKEIYIYVTVAGQKNTVMDSFNKLKNYLYSYGMTNSDGNKFMRYDSSSGAFAIVYDMRNNQFNFIHTLKQDDGTQSATSMIIKMSSPYYANVNYIWTSSPLAFKTKTSFNTASLSVSDILFDIEDQVGFTNGHNYIQELSNLDLRLLLDGCNKFLLRGRVGITFSDLGFTNYRYNYNF